MNSYDEVTALLGAFIGLYITDEEVRVKVDSFMKSYIKDIHEPERSDLEKGFAYFKSLADIGMPGVK